jgi:ABC-2 type transport system ATP-binding protein
MLRIEHLTRRYGSLVALEDVSLAVEAGRIVGLLGANGAGKSTLLRTAAGLQTPDEGLVLVDGVDLWSKPLEAKRALGYAPEDPTFYEDLSAEEYLAFVSSIRGMDPAAAAARADELLVPLGLAGRTREPVRRFSHGMRKKLSFVAAILHQPAALLCDEALEGFDAAAALVAKQELRRLAKQGCAVLFSSHVTETIERLCDSVILLHRGRVARTLQRSEWGGVTPELSALEREFLDVVGTPGAGTS